MLTTFLLFLYTVSQKYATLSIVHIVTDY